MPKLRIKNFGPIKDGFTGSEDGFMDIKKFTVLIGEQGSGKSTMAKLFSTMSWIEKALYRGDMTEEEILSEGKFANECAFHRIHNYFNVDSEIEYYGEAYILKYLLGKISVLRIERHSYGVPKIMYVPAERNFLSSIDNPEIIRTMPLNIFTFWVEMERAMQEMKEVLPLPIGNVSFDYNKHTRTPMIILENGNKLNLTEAASGFHSLIPCYLVCRDLALNLENVDYSKSRVSSLVLGRMNSAMKSVLERLYKNAKYGDGEIIHHKTNALEDFESEVDYFYYSIRNRRFLNVIEEIEQNLFPTAQRTLLYKMIEYANVDVSNSLLITTHSPYIINDLAIAIKAYNVRYKLFTNTNRDLLSEFNELFPEVSIVNPAQTTIYELKDGGIILLPNYNGIPSDENYLNAELEKTNEMFDKLLEIERKI
ncbi:MAG: ATP-binding protein [Bacteroidota bacterium]